MSNDFNTQEPVSVFDFITSINASLLKHRARIEGEVTSVNKGYSSAIYFSIKDTEQEALLNCMMWRTIYNQNGIDINNGDRIIVTGTPDIYAPRGSFSLKVHTIEYAGEGALKKAYDDLKQKLTKEGLLDHERKRALPEFPKKIGVITSRSGVVIQDFNSNLSRYGFHTIMVDSRVEGKDAVHEILAALKTLSKQDIEVLVIMRGGGSWESLQPFNTESVVREIAKFKCPVLTGIGHDVDITLAELVADVGASTPTAVAETLNESWDTLVNSLDTAESKVLNKYRQRLIRTEQFIDSKQGHLLRKYDQILSLFQQRIESATSSVQEVFRDIERMIIKANTAFQKVVGIMRGRLRSLQTEISRTKQTMVKRLRNVLDVKKEEISSNVRRLCAQQSLIIKRFHKGLVNLEQNVKRSDPSRNLTLGYSLSYVNGKLVRSVKNVNVGDTTETQLADGSFTSEIKKVI